MPALRYPVNLTDFLLSQRYNTYNKNIYNLKIFQEFKENSWDSDSISRIEKNKSQINENGFRTKRPKKGVGMEHPCEAKEDKNRKT